MTALTEFLGSTPLTTATWVDWIDIVLFSYLVYRALLFIRGTRALQSLLGFTILGTLWLVSDWFGLTTLHWVLDNLFVWLVLAIIILFQEDIRRALARTGGTLWGRTARASDANTMEEVIRACFFLAQRNIGALVAIERTAALQSHADGGHQLDAQVSAELLQCIFHPASPIHDGAVIISGRQVLAAGVFLPISLSKQIARTYGTRHRAAIGFTEDTDAICLVVSEERGTVAIVQDGEVVPVADANDLRQLLQEGLERGDVRPGAAQAAT